jgi:hypothetical protein
MNIFNVIVHASWNLDRFRALEAQLMANNVDSLLDERTAKALDRLQRYAAANQRTYFKALHELRRSRRIGSAAVNSRALAMTILSPDWSPSPTSKNARYSVMPPPK